MYKNASTIICFHIFTVFFHTILKGGKTMKRVKAACTYQTLVFILDPNFGPATLKLGFKL